MSTIRIDFEDKVFPKVKKRTELILRGKNEVSREIVITDRDQDTLREYFDDFSVKFRNDAGIIHTSSSYEGYLSFTLTEDQEEAELKELAPILVQAAIEYVLFKWFLGLSLFDLANLHNQEYKRKKIEFTANTTQDPAKRPTYYPYF